MKSTYKKSSTSRNRSRTRRAKQARKVNPIRYNISERIITLGRQVRTCFATKYITGSLNPAVSISLDDLVLTSQEWIEISKLWMYVKIQGITVTVGPNNLNTSALPLYMMVNFTSDTVTHIRLNDNVKIVPAFRTRYYQYHYPIPEINAGIGLLNKYTATSGFMLPGRIYLDATGNEDSWYIRVDTKLKFKGSRTQPDAKIQVINTKDLVDKYKDKQVVNREDLIDKSELEPYTEMTNVQGICHGDGMSLTPSSGTLNPEDIKAEMMRACDNTALLDVVSKTSHHLETEMNVGGDRERFDPGAIRCDRVVSTCFPAHKWAQSSRPRSGNTTHSWKPGGGSDDGLVVVLSNHSYPFVGSN